MVKRILIVSAAILLVIGLGLASRPAAADEGSWHGWITDSMCGAKGAKDGHTACAAKCVKEHGAKYVLYNDSDKKLYNLDKQDQAAEQAGHQVTVKGTLEGDSIKVASISAEKEKTSK